ncbi:hypothetical protein MTR67_024045 [Solanum verrucosum]|uniref:Uncharacterized protein n=1 Tax=Solanum verrucosum TaxID=315347 RepID=A0AAF0R0Y2_SOLVR|nr:hypothetical protein MTR67_024045 [Solanum verrucosum]
MPDSVWTIDGDAVASMPYRIGKLKWMLWSSNIPFGLYERVSFSAFRKDFGNLLDFMKRLKNEQNQIALDVNLIEALKYGLTFICTSVQLSYFDLDEFEDEMARKRQKLQPMAEKVGFFLMNDQMDGDYRIFKLTHLVTKITPIDLEVMNICYTNLKASMSAEVEGFLKKL